MEKNKTNEKKLVFKPKTHEYWLDKKLIPSVTQILAPISRVLYTNIKEKTLQHKANIGTKVHQLIEQYLNWGILPSKNNDEVVLQYFDSFLKWKESIKEKVVILETEKKGFYISDTMTYAGTIDCVLAIGDPTQKDENNMPSIPRVVLIDWKTVANPNDTLLSLQLYGYKIMAEQRYNIPIDECAGLCLRKDGYEYHDETGMVKEASTKKLFEHLYELYKLLEFSGIKETAKEYSEESF